MIVKSISELLYDHECLIIPEFGAFISKEHPAMLDYINHRLTPPSKELVFNGQLTADDGAFVGYLAKRQGVTINEAARITHDFAMRSLAILDEKLPLHLEGVGTLVKINSKDFSLTLDENLNFLGDAFGLTSFSLQPIYRTETYNVIAERITAEQKAKNTMMTVHEEKREPQPHRMTRHNYKWFRAAAYSMMIAMVLVLLGWGADMSDSKIASWNPLFYSSPNEFLAKRLDLKVESRVKFAKVDLIPLAKWTLPAFDEINHLESLDNELLKPVNYKPVDNRAYYIIGASLRNEADAQNCVLMFQQQGFEGAMALPKNEAGNVRVAYELVVGRDEALKRLEIIKKENNEDAWMLRK